ncbi:hypothetical protein M0802_007217 [Mischocyttarus mexicanus]|nr:hypothetical protein M0802_007217 [Mischocyttarus mexicanus]
MFGFSEGDFNFLIPRLEHLLCTVCKRQFPESNTVYVPGNLIPLVMSCGHLICNKCDHLNSTKRCFLCKDITEFDKNNSEILPLHEHAVGRAFLLKYASNFKEPYFNTSDCKLQNGHPVKANCYQCEYDASLYCKECNEFLCESCSSKKHGETLLDHIVIRFNGSEGQLITTISSCDNGCSQDTRFYCCKCELNLCLHCFRSHIQHEHFTIEERNYTLLESFLKEYRKIEENKQRIHQAIEVSVLSIFLFCHSERR